MEHHTYTLFFDIFKPNKLISEALSTNNHIATQYVSVLNTKQLIDYPNDLVLNPWSNNVYKHQDIFYPIQRSQELPTVNSSFSIFEKNIQINNLVLVEKTLGELKLSVEHIDKVDYRFSRIEVTPIDIMSKSHLLSSNDPLRAKLLGYGVIRLYKEEEQYTTSSIDSELVRVPGDDTTVAILSVPFYFTSSDLLLGFFDKSVTDNVSHIRLIKTQSPNRFMVLMKFRNKDKVEEFVKSYDGRHFNSIEPETCNVIHIKEVIFRPAEDGNSERVNAIPYLLEDPFTNNIKLKNKSKPSASCVELATCPVCLERLDSSVTGLLTIPCQHTFHCSCLSKWQDDTCPVCRYSSKFDLRKKRKEALEEMQGEEICLECGGNDNLWICLVCGHIGCGRYAQQHAIKHYEDTSHCFAMETTTQRVWDYAGDNYVHRLVQNEADGKLVELPLRDESKKTSDEKVEKIGFEYSKLLISQLESQREYYESIIEQTVSELNFSNEAMSKLLEKNNNIDERLSKVEKLNSIENKLFEMTNSYSEEKTLNEGLSEKIDFLTKDNEKFKQANLELQEQVTDLMFFLESQEKFKDAPDEVKEGQIIMKPTKKKKNKKR